jgi:hypothetical protein
MKLSCINYAKPMTKSVKIFAHQQWAISAKGHHRLQTIKTQRRSWDMRAIQMFLFHFIFIFKAVHVFGMWSDSNGR